MLICIVSTEYIIKMITCSQQVDEYLEQIWSDDRVVQHAAEQKLIDEGYSILAEHECYLKRVHDAGFGDDTIEYEAYWKRLLDYDTN